MSTEPYVCSKQFVLRCDPACQRNSCVALTPLSGEKRTPFFGKRLQKPTEVRFHFRYSWPRDLAGRIFRKVVLVSEKQTAMSFRSSRQHGRRSLTQQYL